MSRSEALLAWYRDHARDLPWRKTRDPYRILVSEVMLQQTQVTRVVAAYERFLEAFPTPRHLADASLDAVLSAWSGLGYNTRARRLRDAARVVARDGWPTSAHGLRALPGVGPYTAAAVASIAFGEEVAVDDTNARRVLSRWTGRSLRGGALRAAAQEELTGDPGTWNQAMMELGAMVCRPHPSCDRCPVPTWCADPTLYAPPPRQTPFSGSHRQVRGAVVRALQGGAWWTHEELSEATGYAVATVVTAIGSLVADALVEDGGGRARIAR